MIGENDGTLETGGEASPGERFVRSYEDYVRQVKEAWWEISQQLYSANSKYQSDLLEFRAEIGKKWADAWRKYTEDVRNAWTDAEGVHSALKAYLRYLDDYQAIQRESAQKWDSRQQAFRDEVCAGRKQYADRCAAAYSKYLDDTKSA